MKRIAGHIFKPCHLSQSRFDRSRPTSWCFKSSPKYRPPHHNCFPRRLPSALPEHISSALEYLVAAVADLPVSSWLKIIIINAHDSHFNLTAINQQSDYEQLPLFSFFFNTFDGTKGSSPAIYVAAMEAPSPTIGVLWTSRSRNAVKANYNDRRLSRCTSLRTCVAQCASLNTAILWT